MTIQVHVTSDLACPWCYVGKRRLDKACAAFPNVSFNIKWHPYIIDPKTRTNGEPYLAYNKRRWGGDGWTHSLREAGKPDGALFADWQWWPNTLQAHRLVLLAQQQGKGHEAEDALFVAQYEQGDNISRIDTLLRIGHALQLQGVEAYMDSSEGLDQVIQADEAAKVEQNIRGVPYFVIQGPTGREVKLSGAQSVNAFKKAFHAVTDG